jgi:hypothetical protein
VRLDCLLNVARGCVSSRRRAAVALWCMTAARGHEHEQHSPRQHPLTFSRSLPWQHHQPADPLAGRRVRSAGPGHLPAAGHQVAEHWRSFPGAAAEHRQPLVESDAPHLPGCRHRPGRWTPIDGPACSRSGRPLTSFAGRPVGAAGRAASNDLNHQRWDSRTCSSRPCWAPTQAISSSTSKSRC